MIAPLAWTVRGLCAAGLALVAFTAAAQAGTGNRHFLWEVTSMTNKAYLFGTIHAGKKEWLPLPGVVERAFEDSQVLVVEADITNLDAMSRTTDGMSYKAPDELSKHVPAADYQRFLQLLGKFSIPEAEVRYMKPFTAVSLLTFGEWGKLGFHPQYGIDAYLIRKARAARRNVVEIEGVESQAELIDSLTEAEHRLAFAGTLTALEEGLVGDQIDGMVKAWLSGDAFLLNEVARRYNEKIPGAGALEDKFIWSRHDAMVEKIDGYLNRSKQRHFIAVGALHLTGPRGLVEMLRKRGYLVKQL